MPRRLPTWPALAGALLAVAPGIVGAQPAPPPDRWQPVRAAISEFLRTTHAGSVSVAVSLGDGTTFAYADGWADRAARRRADTTTRYSIASITKPFTATALMRLVDRGDIALDAPVNRYLGTTPVTGRAAAADSATVARVMSHTAGLPEHLHFFAAGSTPPRMAQTIRRYAFVAFEPGVVHQYSNLGYGMLGDIVARRTHTSFAQAMHRLVFAPLGLSAVVASPGVRPARTAVLYDKAGTAIAPYAFDHDGASAVYASATDLVRFGRMHVGGGRIGATRVLSDSLVQRMQRRHTPADGTGYGLGWELGEEDGRRHVGHSGGMPGVRARLWLFPESDAVVAVLVNGEDWPAAAWDALLSAAAPVVRTAGSTPSSAATPPAPPATVLAAVTGTWTGTVTTIARDMPITVTFDSTGTASATIAGGAAMAVKDLTFADGFVYGLLPTTIRTRDTAQRPGSCWFQLRLRGDGTLTGAVYQGSTDTPFALYTLASYVELRRT